MSYRTLVAAGCFSLVWTPAIGFEEPPAII